MNKFHFYGIMPVHVRFAVAHGKVRPDSFGACLYVSALAGFILYACSFFTYFYLFIKDSP